MTGTSSSLVSGYILQYMSAEYKQAEVLGTFSHYAGPSKVWGYSVHKPEGGPKIAAKSSTQTS